MKMNGISRSLPAGPSILQQHHFRGNADKLVKAVKQIAFSSGIYFHLFSIVPTDS